MALGRQRPRNWGRGAQQAALNILCRERQVAYKVVRQMGDTMELRAAASDGVTTLAFQTVAILRHLGRGAWQADDFISGDIVASGGSRTDVIRKALEKRWR